MQTNTLITEQLIFSEYENLYSNFHPFPTTRYQGSKKKILSWVWNALSEYNFSTVLDAFGGTGCVSHLFKENNKAVTYNDILTFNYKIGCALIKNNNVFLTDTDIDFILNDHNINYPHFIKDTFKDIYYTDDENTWLDKTITNINLLKSNTKRNIAMFALFQSCIIKRPYNLFHRANLYVRTNENVTRSFGNKTTWDKSFNDHFINFVNEANSAIFDNGKVCNSLNKNAIEIDNTYDLVYIDPPYISQTGTTTNYLEFYHFLEGICNYPNWNEMINRNYKHLPIKSKEISPWNDKAKIELEFDKLFKHFKDSILVVSYRKDGIPSIEKIYEIMKKYKSNIVIKESNDYQYALSNKLTKEVLIIGS